MNRDTIYPLLKGRRTRSLAAIVSMTISVALMAAPAHAAVLLHEAFNLNTSSFSGKAGFASKYCADGWTTALNGGVIAKTDNGCSCAARGQGACDYAVYTARGNSCYKSEPVDNLLVAGDSNWTDYTVSVKLRNLDDDTLGLVFRYVNTANYYAVWLSRDVGPGVSAACDGSFPGARLVKFSAKTGGGKGELIAASQLTYKVGKVHLLRVRVQGKSIVVHFDADANGVIDETKELLFNAVDPTHSHGAVGLYAYQNGAAPGTDCAKGGCWFDDLHVESIAPAIAPDAGGPKPDAGGGPADTSGTGPAQDTGAGTAADTGGAHDSGVQDTGSALAPDGAGSPDGGKPSDAAPPADGAADTTIGDGGASGVGGDVDPQQPLTLTVVGGDDDSGCAARPVRGSTSPIWALLAVLAALLLRRRRTSQGAGS